MTASLKRQLIVRAMRFVNDSCSGVKTQETVCVRSGPSGTICHVSYWSG